MKFGKIKKIGELKEALKDLDPRKIAEEIKDTIEIDKGLFERYLEALKEMKTINKVNNEKIEIIIDGITFWLKKMKLARKINKGLNKQGKLFEKDIKLLKEMNEQNKIDKIDEVINDVKLWVNELAVAIKTL